MVKVKPKFSPGYVVTKNPEVEVEVIHETRLHDPKEPYSFVPSNNRYYRIHSYSFERQVYKVVGIDHNGRVVGGYFYIAANVLEHECMADPARTMENMEKIRC